MARLENEVENESNAIGGRVVKFIIPTNVSDIWTRLEILVLNLVAILIP